MKSGIKKTAWLMVAALLLCLGFLFAMFYRLTQQYKDNSALSSASHLIEISRQCKTNVGAYMQKDRDVARDIASELESGSIGSEEALYAYIRQHEETWQEKIRVYTASGLCFSDGGLRPGNGSAAFAAAAAMDGETFRVVGSETECGVAVTTGLQIHGSDIAAVAVVRNLDGLLDDMGLSSFDGSGSVYLTRQDGVKICSNSGENVRQVYNVVSLFDAGTLKNLQSDGLGLKAVMAAGKEGAFLFSGAEPTQYVILTPVRFLDETLYLITVVPQAAVNRTMDDFSHHVAVLTTGVVLLTILIFLTFFFLYLRRSRSYSAELRARERLFDLLVSETNNAYMLLSENEEKPVYVSSNTAEILQEPVLRLCRDGGGYRLAGESGETGGVLSRINEALADWDGAGEFVSSYLPAAGGRCLRLCLYPVSTKRGEVIGIVQDVTPEYRREQALREALTLADSANRAKTRFLSSVSHDIRTPLNAIINMTRFLQQDRSDDEKCAERLEVISCSSAHLLELINDVLDLSRIESGKLSFTDEPFDLSESLRAIRDIVRPLCEAKGQRFCWGTDVSHTKLVGDALRLNQILINILNNAVKFTPAGGEVGFDVTELPAIKPGSVPLRFAVRDSGIGIPPDRLESIFDPFSRVEEKRVRETEGSGLGLAITKSFVEALGGSIRVVSEPGRGSVFTVELTYREDSAAGAPAAPAAPAGECRFDGLRALLAEDNAINAEIAETILAGWGFAVETAANGRLALERFTGREPGYYDVIYMDVRMPEMNGYEATQAIRASGRPDAAGVPVIAMTANAFAEDVERARAAGMNAHVAKPIEPAELRCVTAALLKIAPEEPDAGGEENK